MLLVSVAITGGGGKRSCKAAEVRDGADFPNVSVGGRGDVPVSSVFLADCHCANATSSCLFSVSSCVMFGSVDHRITLSQAVPIFSSCASMSVLTSSGIVLI